MIEDFAYSNSAELCERMAEITDTVLLSFSGGKDSIAAWLQMRKYFKRVVPYYMYFVPGLKFIERSLEYYEDFFGCHIYQFPHPAFFKKMNLAVYQPPHRLNAIAEKMYVDLSTYDVVVISEMIRNTLGLSENAYTGVGIRQADTPMRRLSITKSGAVVNNRKTFYPVYDWKKEDIIRAIDESGIKLPVDYKMFGRSFDGLGYTYLKPLKEWFPDDYKRLLGWFPFAELELARRGETDGLRTREDFGE